MARRHQDDVVAMATPLLLRRFHAYWVLRTAALEAWPRPWTDTEAERVVVDWMWETHDLAYPIHSADGCDGEGPESDRRRLATVRGMLGVGRVPEDRESHFHVATCELFKDCLDGFSAGEWRTELRPVAVALVDRLVACVVAGRGAVPWGKPPSRGGPPVSVPTRPVVHHLVAMTALVVWMDSRDDDDDPCRRRLVAWSDSMAVVRRCLAAVRACAPDMRMRTVSLWEEEEEGERAAACHVRTAANVWGTCLATLAQMLVNLVEHRVTTRLRVPLGEGETILDATRLALMLSRTAGTPTRSACGPSSPSATCARPCGRWRGRAPPCAAAGGTVAVGLFVCADARWIAARTPSCTRRASRRAGTVRCSGAGSRAPPRRSWRSAPSGTAPASWRGTLTSMPTRPRRSLPSCRRTTSSRRSGPLSPTRGTYGCAG